LKRGYQMGEVANVVRQVASPVVEGYQQVAEAAVGAVQAVAEGGGAEAIGDKLGLRVNQVAGAGFTVATGGLAESEIGQTVLENPTANLITLGTSQDIAGTARAARAGRYLRDIDPEDLSDVGRLGAKVATFGVAADISQSYNLANQIPTWGELGYGLSTAATGSLVADKIKKGDLAGAAADLGAPIPPGILPGPSQPQPPRLGPPSPGAQDSTPSYWPDFSSIGQQAISGQNIPAMVAIGAVGILAVVLISRAVNQK
jgi:hypothetical protein